MNFELLVGRPLGSPLFEDYLGGAESAAPFYSGSWQDPKSYRALLDYVDARFDSDARRRALGALTIPEGLDPERLEGAQLVADDRPHIISRLLPPARTGRLARARSAPS